MIETLLMPEIVFLLSIAAAAFLVLNPWRFLSEIYPLDDRNAGLVILIFGSLYFQYHVIDPTTGIENILSGLSRTAGFIGFVAIFVRGVLGVDW